MKLGWFLPLTIADPYFIAIKAGVAASLSAAMSLYIANNPDLVSACFIAIVSISPTPLLGLKSSFGQLLNSFIGGFWGILMRIIGLHMVYGVGVAVALGIFCSFVARQSNFWVASAFSAYFVQVIDYNGIANTAKVRALALSVGSVCALAVNVTVSIFFTKHMLGRRMQIAKDMVVAVLSIGVQEVDVKKEGNAIIVESGGSGNREADRGTQDEFFQKLEGLDAASQGIFAALNTLLGELYSVSTEAKFLRLKPKWLDHHIFRARKLKQLLHLTLQFAYEAQNAREELPLSAHEQLANSTKLFLERISKELKLVEVAKNSNNVEISAKEENSTKADEHIGVEMRVNGVIAHQEFPAEHLKRVARDIEWLVEEIRNGVPTLLLKGSGEPLLHE